MRTWYIEDVNEHIGTRAYNELHDLLNDLLWSDDPRIQDLIEEFVSEIYPPVEIPGIGKVEMGKLMIAYYDQHGYGLDAWIDDYLAYLEDGIEGEAEFCNDRDEDFEWNILNYKITCI